MLQDFPWQEAIVGACVLAAVFFLTRRWIFPSTKKAAGCGSCGSCDKTSTSSCSNPDDKTK